MKLVIKLSPIGGFVRTVKSINNFSENHPWISDTVHLGLSVAGMVPGIGWMCDSANAVLYACEGDFKNAAWSVASVVPGVAMAGYASKGFKTVDNVGDFAKLMSTIEKADDATEIVKVAGSAIDMKKGVDVSKDVLKGIEKGMEIKKATDWGVFGSQTTYNTSSLTKWILDEENRLNMSKEDITRELIFGTLNDFGTGTVWKGISMI